MSAPGPQDQVAIAGLGMTPMLRTPTVSPLELAADAVRRAAADAGLALSDIDGLLVNPAAPNVPGMFLQQILGLRDLRMLANVQQFGSSAGAMIQYASMAVASGLATTVACVFTDAPITGEVMRYAQLRDITGLASYEQAIGVVGANPRYALAARRHMLEYGTTTEQFGAVAVAQRAWAQHNPLALAREPMTLADHAASRWVAEPFRLFDICFVCNGAIAVIVTAKDRARDLAKPPVHIWGWGQAHPGMTQERGSRFGLTSGAVDSGRRAFEMAGVGVRDVTLCQIYDCYTFTVIVTLEDYGFCAKGEGGPFVADGRLRLGGALPTNTDGGGLSACHPGMRGMFLLVEAVRQLRHEAEGRQVPDAELCAVNGTGGWFSATGTVILGRG